LVVAGVLNVPAFCEEALDHLASEGLRLIHDFNIWLLKHTQKKKPGKKICRAPTKRLQITQESKRLKYTLNY
jgi:hypothetical protein